MLVKCIKRGKNLVNHFKFQMINKFFYRARIPSEEFELGLVRANLEGTAIENGCGHPAICPSVPSKYRTQDGKCNNPDPAKSNWGAGGSPMERLLPPAYEDGIWEPRALAYDGSPLTNARTISRELLIDIDRPHPLYNLLLMQFGQFITHDVSQSASITQGDSYIHFCKYTFNGVCLFIADGQSVSCCSEDGSTVLPSDQSHYSCFAIPIEGQDEFFSQFNQGCLNVVRSALSVDNECKLGYGKQLSKVSHFLDGSAIYGSDLRLQGEVRAFRRGLLRTMNDFGREMLPLSEGKKSCGQEQGPCFLAGMRTFFLRIKLILLIGI